MSTELPPRPTRSLLQWLREMPRWKQILLGTAMAALIIGGVLTLVHGPAPQPATADARSITTTARTDAR